MSHGSRRAMRAVGLSVPSFGYTRLGNTRLRFAFSRSLVSSRSRRAGMHNSRLDFRRAQWCVDVGCRYEGKSDVSRIASHRLASSRLAIRVTGLHNVSVKRDGVIDGITNAHGDNCVT